MKAAVTGALGFIGRSFLEQYADRISITALYRPGHTAEELSELPQVTDQECHYTLEELTEFLKGMDAVVHLAFQKVVRGEPDGLRTYASSIESFENVLKAAHANGIRNVIVISSRCVYGEENTLPFSEEQTADPINFYAVGKLVCEQMSAYYNKKFGMCIKNLRLAQVIGYPMSDGYMFSTFLKQILSGERVNIWGNGVGKRDYIYLKDVNRAIYCALQNQDVKGIFNIGSGIGLSNLEIAKTMKEVFQSNSEICLLKEKAEDTSLIYLDVSKAKRELGFVCQYTMKTTIEEIRKQYGLC